MLEQPENFGETISEAEGKVERREVPSFGDWREFYANVRDCLLGKADLQVTPEQALNVMIALQLAQQSSAAGWTLDWKAMEI